MFELLLERIRLMFRFWYLIPLRLIKVFQGKQTMNEFIAQLEMNKLENRLHFWKTIYFCFRTMPLNYAWKTPVWIYGDIKFFDLRGKVIPVTEDCVYPKSVVIGHMDQARSVGDVSSITLRGHFFYGKNTVIRQGAKWKISGNLTIGKNCYIGDNVSFFIDKECRIGDECQIANNSMLMDTDIHYMLDIKTMTVKNNKKAVCIGKGCWLGGYTMVKKGTILPDYTIVAGPYSCVGKDYTKELKPYSCIGGYPAKFIKSGLREINNGKMEFLLNNYFKHNQSPFSCDGDIDDFCSKNI